MWSVRSKAARAVVSVQGVCKEQRVEHQIPSRLYRHLGTDAAGRLATEETNGRHAGAGDGGCANSKPFQAAAQRWTQQLRVVFSRAAERASIEIEKLLLSKAGDHVILARFIVIGAPCNSIHGIVYRQGTWAEEFAPGLVIRCE